MRIRSRVSITLCAVLLSLTIATNGQRASIKTANGYLFIQNGKDISIVCEIKGKDIKPLTTGENPAFMADGFLLQIIWVPAGNFEPTGKVEPAKLLETHQKWETDYLATVFGTTPLPATESVDLDGKRVMYWSFKRPKHSTEFDRDSFLTTLVGRNIFGVNSPIKIGTDAKESRRRMTEVLRSLRTRTTPFDVAELADAIKKGKDPFQ